MRPPDRWTSARRTELRAILSDIHSNLEALLAVLEAADGGGASLVTCLGDVVGYGANPNEAVDLLSGRSDLAVMGNHDRAAFEPGAESGMNDWARTAAEWTRAQMGEDEAAYLSDLPLTARSTGALFVHSSPESPERWSYVLTLDDARRAFSSFREPLCFIGHSHTPAFFEEANEQVRALDGDTLELRAGRRYMVNVGSVGQPRDGDPRASFALFDSGSRRVKIVRVAYDVETAREKIISAGLPRELGDRLLEGH